MLCIAWVGSAWADTTLLTEANGWQKVTDLSSLNLSDYYFAFVDNDKDLMLSFEEGVNQSTDIAYKTMVYRTGARAELTPAMLWIISETPDNAMIRSVVSNLFLQCETNWDAKPSTLQPWYCHTHDVYNSSSGGESWARWKFAYDNGSWTIENKKGGSQYIGPWTEAAFKNGMEVAGNKTKDASIGHFQIYAIKKTDVDWLAIATQSNPANISYKITNANAGYKDTSGWTATGSYKRNGGTGFDDIAGFLEFWNGNAWSGTFSQDISDLSNGKYRIRVAGQQSASGVTSTLTAGTGSVQFPSNGTEKGTILASGEETTEGKGIKGWRYVTTETYVTEGKLTIKMESSGTAGTWANFDNVELYYLGKNLRDGSTSATSGVSATAGTWYAIPVNIAGTYTLTPSVGTVYYTQNGEYMPDDAEAKATSVSGATDLELSAGYLYINASKAATITLVANIKEYTVGSATTSTNYIQAGQTVTVTYADATTNDESAKFEHLTGDITLNGEPVDVNVTGTSFTFTLPAEAKTSSTYTLSIPAGAFGYSGKKTCDAQTFTFNTPAVFDGKYFIKATDATYGGKYISRGAHSNTEAALDPWGLPVTITTGANNVSTIYFVDNNKPLVLNANNIAYTDGKLSNANHKYTYTIAATADGCTLYNIDKAKYLAAGVRNDNEVATASDEPYSWQFVTPADHTAEMTALKDKQAAAAAKAAGKTAATVAELKAIVEAWHGNTTENLTLTGDEFYSDAGNQKEAVGTRSNTVTISKAGLYKFSMPAYTRASSANEAYANHLTETEALVAYIFFGDYKTQIRSLYSVEGKTEATANYLQPSGAIQWWPNNTATGDTEFAAGKYANEIWMYLEAGDYTYGITNNSKGLCASWTYFNAPTLTYCSENSYAVFAELYKKCKPWTESTGSGDYVATYNSYASYADGTDYGLLNAAINYMNANFKTYAWDNASLEHPYLVEDVISRSDCTTNGLQDPTTDWAGKGRSTKNGQHWSGDASRVYFTQNHENGAARSQTVTIPSKGVYMLKTSIRPINSAAYAEISVGSETVRTYGPTGTTGGTIATDGKEYESVEAGLAAGATFANGNKGFGWIYQNLIFNTSADNETKEIKINLSNQNDNREADCGGMFLYYVGQTYDKIEGNTHYYYGNYATAPSFEVTEDVPVVDATKAAVTGATVTRTNPNGLVYLASGSTADGNNVVIDGTCANLVLTDGYPFTATKNFTATNASYNMTAVAGGKFGTLMLPYAVTTLPGKAYSLDADINAIDGTINGSEVTSVPANSPVLVTAAGNYAGSNVDVAVTSAGTLYTNGHLTGVYQATSALVGSYVLQNHTATNGVAFYLVGNVQPTVKPFRAYIPALNNNVKAIKVIFDGDTTGISDIDNDNNSANDIIYDLSGRKVTKAHKGVYIINGKKTVK